MLAKGCRGYATENQTVSRLQCRLTNIAQPMKACINTDANPARARVHTHVVYVHVQVHRCCVLLLCVHVHVHVHTCMCMCMCMCKHAATKWQGTLAHANSRDTVWPGTQGGAREVEEARSNATTPLARVGVLLRRCRWRHACLWGGAGEDHGRGSLHGTRRRLERAVVAQATSTRTARG